MQLPTIPLSRWSLVTGDSRSTNPRRRGLISRHLLTGLEAYISSKPSVTLEEIEKERARGWRNFHPERYCHKCGNRNVWSWAVDSDEWNRAIRNPDGSVREGYPGSEILCPSCFVYAHEEVTGDTSLWTLVREPD